VLSLAKAKSAKRKKETRGTVEENEPDYLPFSEGPCTACGLNSFAPVNCPVEMNSSPCTWMERQEDAGPHGEAIFVRKTGTRKELLGI